MNEEKKKRLAELTFEIIGSQSTGLGLKEKAKPAEQLHNAIDKNKFAMKMAAVSALGGIGGTIMPTNEAYEVLKDTVQGWGENIQEKVESAFDFGDNKVETDSFYNDFTDSSVSPLVNHNGLDMSLMTSMEGKFDSVEVLSSTFAMKDYSFSYNSNYSLTSSQELGGDIAPPGGLGDVFNSTSNTSLNMFEGFSIPEPSELTAEVVQTNDMHFTQANGISDDAGTDVGGGALFAMAVGALLLSQGLTKIPSIYKLFKHNRELNEMTLTNGYAENIKTLADNMRKLSDNDARVDAIMEDMYTGDLINDFDDLLTMVISTPHQHIDGVIDNLASKLAEEKYEAGREKVALQSANLARELIAYDISTKPMINSELVGMAKHSSDLAELVIKAHDTDADSFESEHPQLFNQMKRAGVIAESKQNIKGFGDLFGSQVEKAKRAFGMDNGDVLQQAKLAINIKRNIEGVAGHGLEAHIEQKAILGSIAKVAKEASPNLTITEDVLNSVQTQCSTVEKYLGISEPTKATTPRPRTI